MNNVKWLSRVVVFAVLCGICTRVTAQEVSDYHQHLLSPTVAQLVKASTPYLANDLVPLLDAGGVHRAVILSLAYQFGNPNRAAVLDEYSKVKAENDWTSAQVALFPTRLIGFCGVNPLRDYAAAEIDRCSHDPFLKTGLKLHFGNSDVDLDNPEHVASYNASFARLTSVEWRLQCIFMPM